MVPFQNTVNNTAKYILRSADTVIKFDHHREMACVAYRVTVYYWW